MRISSHKSVIIIFVFMYHKYPPESRQKVKGHRCPFFSKNNYYLFSHFWFATVQDVLQAENDFFF